MSYKEAIEAAISDDETRKRLSLSQWRAYFLEDVSQIPQGTKVTSTGILNALGPIAGAILVSGIESANPVVGNCCLHLRVDWTSLTVIH